MKRECTAIKFKKAEAGIAPVFSLFAVNAYSINFNPITEKRTRAIKNTLFLLRDS